MPNRFVIFPAGQQTEAEAYKAFGDTWYQNLSGEVGGVLGLLQQDAYGQWVTVYAGPPFVWSLERGEEPEPEDGPAMRADGVLADDWTRPSDEM